MVSPNWLGLLSLASTVLGHCHINKVYGYNGKNGIGFGVDTSGKVGRRRQDRDVLIEPGADATVFTTNTNSPVLPCGVTPMSGPIDVSSWVDQALANGLPSTRPDGSVIITVYQFNMDGGGPMMCEYSNDIKLPPESFKPLKMLTNYPGNNGLISPFMYSYWNVTVQFPPCAVCDQGPDKNFCIVRCRAGYNNAERKPLRFGGCFLITLSEVCPTGGQPSLNDPVCQVPAPVHSEAPASLPAPPPPPAMRKLMADAPVSQDPFVPAALKSTMSNTPGPKKDAAVKSDVHVPQAQSEAAPMRQGAPVPQKPVPQTKGNPGDAKAPLAVPHTDSKLVVDTPIAHDGTAKTPFVHDTPKSPVVHDTAANVPAVPAPLKPGAELDFTGMKVEEEDFTDDKGDMHGHIKVGVRVNRRH